MSVKRNSHHLSWLIILAFLLPYNYGGCVAIFSSGDGDDDGIFVATTDDGQDTITDGFIIIVNQASIGAENAKALVGLNIKSDPTTLESGQAALRSSSAASSIPAYRPLDFTFGLGYSLRHITLGPTLFVSSQSEAIREAGTADGSCGGFFSYGLNLDRPSKQFDGILSFEDYCDGGIRISGDAAVLGTLEPNSGDLLIATFSFNNLVAGSFTLEGELSIDFSGTPAIAVFTVHAKDTVSGWVYWLQDYSINITEWVDRVEIELTGTFHHPVHGFVDLATTDPFLIHDEDDWPASGKMVMQGEHGTGALLTVIDPLRFGIKADTSGNGTYEWDSGVLRWTDL